VEKENSIASIAKELKTSSRQISRLLKEAMIDIRNSSDSHKIYEINEDVFECIDSQEKAYWLGFLYADGYIKEDVNSIVIQLKSDDKQHLEKFYKFVGSNKEVLDLVVNKKYNHSRATITNKKMTSDLVSLGCKQKKSLVLEFPTSEMVSDEFIYSFILGYYDGDGGISISKEKGKNNLRCRFSFTGTKEFLNGVQMKLNTNKNLRREHRCKNNTYYFKYGKSEGVAILEKMYNASPIHLERKYERFLEAKNSIIRKRSPLLK